MNWIMYVPSVVFSKIKANFSADLKNKYGMTDENFSTSAVLNTNAMFPFIYVKTLGGTEQGADLEGQAINAASFTFQIEVTDNRSQARSREIMAEVVRIMKEMRFQMNALPLYEDTENIHVATARFQRMIGSGDGL